MTWNDSATKQIIKCSFEVIEHSDHGYNMFVRDCPVWIPGHISIHAGPHWHYTRCPAINKQKTLFVLSPNISPLSSKFKSHETGLFFQALTCLRISLQLLLIFNWGEVKNHLRSALIFSAWKQIKLIMQRFLVVQKSNNT